MTNKLDGWIGWNGGDCPVDEKAVVDVRLSSGTTIMQTPAGRWLWSRPRHEIAGLVSAPSQMKAGGVIVAYRESEELV